MIDNKSIKDLEASKLIGLSDQIDTEQGGSSWRTGGGSGNPNVRAVTNLTELQAVLANEIADIQGAVDLANTDVTLPADVYVRDGGGSIISTGTGELTLTTDSEIDATLLDYRLTVNGGRLAQDTYYFDITKSGITEGTVDDATALINKQRLQHLIDQVHELKGVRFKIGTFDAYFSVPITLNRIGTEYSRRNPLIIHSDTHLDMAQDTYLRIQPDNSFGSKLIMSFKSKNVKITGGNLIGDRWTHDYSAVNDEQGTPRNSHEFGALLIIGGVHNMLVEGVYMDESAADCIIIDGSNIRNSDGSLSPGEMETRNCTIRGCTLKYGRRNNISLIDGSTIIIENNDIMHAGMGYPFPLDAGVVNASGRLPMNNIDIEPYQEGDPDNIYNTKKFEDGMNIIISNNRFSGAYELDVNCFKGNRILIENNTFTNQVNIQYSFEVTIQNNTCVWDENLRNRDGKNTETFTAVGGETTYTFAELPVASSNYRVIIDSTELTLDTDYEISSDRTQINFLGAYNPLTVGQEVSVEYHPASDSTKPGITANNVLKISAGGTYELVYGNTITGNTVIGYDAGISMQGRDSHSAFNKVYDFKRYGLSTSGTNIKHSNNYFYSDIEDAMGIEGQNGSPVSDIESNTFIIPNGRGFYLDNVNTGVPSGSVELEEGTTGEISMITVDGVNIMSGAEVFDTDINTTMANVAANITAHTSSPNYNATASGDTVKITHADGGTNGEFFEVVSTVTGDFVTEDIDFREAPQNNKINIYNNVFKTKEAGYARDAYGIRFIGNEIQGKLSGEDCFKYEIKNNTSLKTLTTEFISWFYNFNDGIISGNDIESSATNLIMFNSASTRGVNNTEIVDNIFRKIGGTRIIYFFSVTTSLHANNKITRNRTVKDGSQSDISYQGDNTVFLDNFRDEGSVTINDGGTGNLIKYTKPNSACPSYADNATALAALGEGFFYKDTTTGKFEITIT